LEVFDEIFLTFFECAKRGSWDVIADPVPPDDVGQSSKVYDRI